MAIKVKCPSCNAILSAQLKLAHKTMKCPKCKTKFEAVPIEEVQQVHQHAHDKMAKARERFEVSEPFEIPSSQRRPQTCLHASRPADAML
jgi:predicted Zn finger-like uncharacterized protein